MEHEGSDTSASIPIRIHGQGDLPIYRQIRHQLSYLISSERLASGTRLPAVRVLADELQVSPQTVANAYRDLQQDGLIESHAGRGSFVRAFGESDQAASRRSGLLTDTLRQARARARTLGFSDEDMTRRLSALMSQERSAGRIIFVDASPHIATKYAERLEHYLGTTHTATGLTLNAVESRDAHTFAALEDAYYVVTFARTAPALEELLQTDRHELTTIASEVTPETTRVLAAFPAGLSSVLLTEERYIHATLNLITVHSALDASRVSVYTPSDLSTFHARATESDIAFCTFSVKELISDADLPVPLHNLEFDISRESVAKLRRLLDPAQIEPII